MIYFFNVHLIISLISKSVFKDSDKLNDLLLNYIKKVKRGGVIPNLTAVFKIRANESPVKLQYLWRRK